MAIEFNCPYCSALIRVPDNAGGGKGRCPKCATRIKVPKYSTAKPVAPPAEPPPPTEQSPVMAPHVEESVEPDHPREIENFFDPDYDPRQAATPKPEPDPFSVVSSRLPTPPTTSIAAKVKRQSNPIAWLVPVACGLVLCGIFGWFMWQQYMGEQLGGELTAETAHELELIPALVDKSSIRQPADDLDQVLSELERNPLPLLSSLMQIQMRGSSKGVLVYLSAGPKARFYRVSIRKHEPLLKFQSKQAAEFEQQRLKEIDETGTAFAIAYRKVMAKKADQMSLTEFRNTLALPALVRGLGNQVVAVYGRTIYPCVYEDHEGAWYFLLPHEANEFEITGRKYENGAVLFPAKYKVKVAGQIKVPEKIESESDTKSKTSKQSDSTADDEPEEMMDDKDAAMKKDE